MSTTTRTYADAIDSLNSLQSNAAVIEAIRLNGGKDGLVKEVETLEFLRRIGYEPSDLDRLNVIHVTGTKGKGSTCAFTDSILRTLAPSARVGLYTSPHLVAVRERIRINGKPIEEEMFARYFFEVWEKLEQGPKVEGLGAPEKPAYFRYLTLMAFHVFLQEKVDATVLEVGVGGTYDTTNIVPKPVVAGVSSIGIDHIFVLGKTIPEIATQKGGIYKPGVPALAIDQPGESLDVLRSRATELHASSFSVVPTHSSLLSIPIGLAGAHQRTNASLAIALVQAFLSSPRLPPAFAANAISLPSPLSTEEGMPELPLEVIAPELLGEKMVQGLKATNWPGRCQIAKDATKTALTWYLDGAHTVESLQCCGDWFGAEVIARLTSRVLIFNCTSGRDGLSLLGTLSTALSSFANPFQHVIFCTNTTFASGASKGDLTSKAVDVGDLEQLKTQHQLAAAWEKVTELHPGTEAVIHVLSSIEEAVSVVRILEGETDVLVTGSLHLVGGVMAIAELPLDL